MNALSEACGLSSAAGAASPLGMQKTAGATLLRWAGAIFGVYVVVTSSTITARSGGVLGTGTATIQAVSGGTTPALTPLSGVPAINVYSISSTTGGIPSGAYGIALRVAGLYFLITVDCGN